MSDPADLAAPAVQAFQENALAAHRARAAADAAHPVNTAGRCRDCSDAIEPRRLAANPRAQRCVICQLAHEKRIR